MAITEIEDRITDIIDHKDRNQFIYDFLSVYDFPKATITKLRKGTNNLSKEPGEVYLKNRLYFKQVSGDLMQSFVDVKEKVNQLGSKPRYIMVTDFEHVLAEDTKTNDTLDVEFQRLPQKFEFFLAWNGIEKADFDKENPADIRAAERFAKLYDVVVKDNPHASRKGLNLFLIRVLFCLFAEDTNIFENNLFTNRVKQMTKEDGTDFDAFVSQLFGVLDFEKSQRPVDTPSWLNDFPYVDGDLFKDPHESLMFSSKSRKLIIDAGELLNWNQVNPDILGSMIQAVASEDSRSHLGMHYTSVPNIMKVIKPLFLDGLREDFEAAKGNEDKLQKLYDRIGNIKFMDPACGSGNFLIITYKELRQLEIDILIELNNIGVSTMYVPSVTLDQFYGIEIDDFACDVTRLSLWIAEHQMNKQLHKEIADAVRPTLPLQHAGAIVNGNALTIDWQSVMDIEPEIDEAYLFGNPPYLGAKKQNEKQKEDLCNALDQNPHFKKLDYISAWFYLGAKYISGSKAALAFVTTNSIVQGEQVDMLWPAILQNCEIILGYKSFLWSNNAKKNAGVTVSIVGLMAKGHQTTKKLFDTAGHFVSVEHISPYLVAGSDLTVSSRTTSLSNLPDGYLGCLSLDKGNFIFSEEQYDEVTAQYPELTEIFKKYGGSSELIHNKFRRTLWMNEESYKKFSLNPVVAKRVEAVYQYRISGGVSARGAANTPFEFFTRKVRDEKIINHHNNNDTEMLSILVPRVSSQNRLYVPMGIVGEDTVISDSATAIYDAPMWLFGLLESRIHMEWLKNVGGRLKTDFRYSANLVYNTFPVPEFSTRRKNEIEDLVWKILDIRDEEGGTLAELYGSPLAAKNPKPMNSRLKAAHEELDRVVDRAYRDRPFKDDNERLALLLDMYSKKVSGNDK